MIAQTIRGRSSCAALLTLLLLSVGCSRQETLPDILFVSIDTLRADRVGCYGHAAASTPTMDRLAREGVRYANCQSPIPVTLPSHTSMMTGLYPPEHGVRNNASYRLPAQVPTLAEELKLAGYSTAAFVAALPLAARFGLDRGFDHYDASLPDERASLFTFRERPASEVVRAATEWVRGRDRETPVFLWAHFFEPHSPYEANASLADDPYDAEVAVADRALGLLIERVTSLRGAAPLVLVTSDHGEGLGEHGENTHAIFLYQTTLRVPLLLHAPGRWPAGVVVEEPVSLVDLAPTLLRELGIEPQRMKPTGIALDVGSTPPRRALYSESIYAMEAYRWAPLFATREGPQKVIRSRRSWAFDLAEDPGETRDLAGEASPWVDEQLASLESEILRLAALDVSAGREPSEEELEALAALGYVGAVASSEAAPELIAAMEELPDATERHSEFARTRRAEGLVGQGEYEQAVDELRGVLDENPDNVWAHMLMGQALGSNSQNRAAIASYRRAIELRPDWLDAHRSLARLHARLDETDQALVAYADALSIDPTDSELRLEAAALLQRSGRLIEAETLLSAGLEHGGDPLRRASMEAALARICFQQGRLDVGRVYLENARAVHDDAGLRLLAANYSRRAQAWQEVLDTLGNVEEWGESAEAHELRGEAQQRLGLVVQAVASYQFALSIDAERHLAHNNLAWALAVTLERPDEALSHALAAIQLLPTELEYHDTYLEVLGRLGREDEARRYLRDLLKQYPGNETLERRASALRLR